MTDCLIRVVARALTAWAVWRAWCDRPARIARLWARGLSLTDALAQSPDGRITGLLGWNRDGMPGYSWRYLPGWVKR